MSYLIGQMLLCLLLAALLGFLVGWFWRRWICNQKIAELESAIASLKAKPAAAAPVAAAVAAAKEEDELTKNP